MNILAKDGAAKNGAGRQQGWSPPVQNHEMPVYRLDRTIGLVGACS